MKRSIRIGGAAVCALAISAAYAQTRPADTGVPHLEKRGVATQLIVDGKPFLVLGAEPPTSGASNLEYLRYTLQVMATTHQNTAAIAVAWAWIEPEKGKYDFRIVDAAIEDARKIGERIVLVWFGSWKNGQSNCAPGWVKADQDRFPRAQVKGGQTVEALSPLNENNWEADARVFAVLMRHIREVDRTHRVIMVQVENEIGIFGDSRDRSPLADKAFAGAIPAELMDYLQKHKEGLHPELRKVWEAAGFKTNGTWQEVFGKGPEADEIFMAWNYARYVNHVADAGKKEYPIPMFANTWGSQGWGKGPHGEPMDHVHDIWKAGAPMVDTFAPDAYMGMQGVANHIVDLTTRYTNSGIPFFTVEAMDGEIGAAHAFYAIGQQRAIGFSGMGNDGLLQWFTQTGLNLPAVVSPPGMDSPARLVGFGGPGTTAPLPPIPPEYEAKALSQAFLTLSQIAPQILEHQSKGTIAGVVLDKEKTEEQVKLGNYILNVGLPRRGGRGQDPVPDVIGYGLFMATGPDEYLLAGNNVLITFTPNTPGPPIAGLVTQEAGRFDNNGKWVATHFLIGDDSMITNTPPVNQSGSGVRLAFGERAIQRVTLYRYR
jgi:beta-galactosidase GanA